MTDAVPARPVFDEPRAYIDDSRWYTVCPEPQPGDFDFDLCNPHSFYAMSSSVMECSTMYAARTDGTDPHLPEPRKPRTPLLFHRHSKTMGPLTVAAIFLSQTLRLLLTLVSQLMLGTFRSGSSLEMASENAQRILRTSVPSLVKSLF